MKTVKEQLKAVWSEIEAHAAALTALGYNTSKDDVHVFVDENGFVEVHAWGRASHGVSFIPTNAGVWAIPFFIQPSDDDQGVLIADFCAA